MMHGPINIIIVMLRHRHFWVSGFLNIVVLLTDMAKKDGNVRTEISSEQNF